MIVGKNIFVFVGFVLLIFLSCGNPSDSNVVAGGDSVSSSQSVSGESSSSFASSSSSSSISSAVISSSSQSVSGESSSSFASSSSSSSISSAVISSSSQDVTGESSSSSASSSSSSDIGSAVIPADIGGPFAVPGAKGFGRFTRGAYAGSATPTILYVDTLTSASVQTGTDRGSFTWALSQDYPRIILFEVSGYINTANGNTTAYWDGLVKIRNHHLSIYGQTAPGKGITVTGSGMEFFSNNLIIQHVKFRGQLEYDPDEQIDPFSISGGENVFIDHCSFSYGIDENSGIGGTFAGPLTFSNNIVSYGLGTDSKGMLVTAPLKDASIIGNAFINSITRPPLINGSAYENIELINNMNYNSRYNGIQLYRGSSPRITFIGNVYKAGPESIRPDGRKTISLEGSLDSTSQLYVYDNLYPGYSEGVDESDCIRNNTGYELSRFISTSIFNHPTTQYYPASTIEENLVAYAGAFYWNRDAVDEMALTHMQNSSGHYFTALSDAIFPDIPEEHRTLTVPENPHEDPDGNGYTNLEEWVYWMTIHE